MASSRVTSVKPRKKAVEPPEISHESNMPSCSEIVANVDALSAESASGIKPKTKENSKSQMNIRFAELSENGCYETVAVRTKGKAERHSKMFNFVLQFKYMIRGTKNEPLALSGWNVIVLCKLSNNTSLFIPCTKFATPTGLLKYLQENTEIGAILNVFCDKSILDAYVDFQQTEFLKSESHESKVREHVTSLGLQPDGATLIMGRHSRGIFRFETDGGQVTFCKITEEDCKYRWLDQLNLADFDTDLFCEGSDMFGLMKELYSERHLLNFCIVTGFVILPFFKDFVRLVLCPQPTAIFTGPPGSLKTRTFENTASILGYEETEESAWKWMNFISATSAGVETLAKKHPFPIMVSDADNMALLESVTKMTFDGASKVVNRGIKEIPNGILLACNEDPLHNYAGYNSKSTTERHVLLFQTHLKKISEADRERFARARETFSGHLPSLIDPRDSSPLKQCLKEAYLRFKESFYESLRKKGVQEQAARLSETYAFSLALGATVHFHFEQISLACGSTSTEKLCKGQVYEVCDNYFQKVLVSEILSMQVSQTDHTGVDIPSILCRIIVMFMQLNSKEWHSKITWWQTNGSHSNYPSTDCIGLRTNDIYEFLDGRKSCSEPEIEVLLQEVTVTQIKTWMKQKVNGVPRADLKGTVNHFCSAQPSPGEVMPIRELGEDFLLIADKAKQLNHDPLVFRCAYHSRTKYRTNLQEKDLARKQEEKVLPEPADTLLMPNDSEPAHYEKETPVASVDRVSETGFDKDATAVVHVTDTGTEPSLSRGQESADDSAILPNDDFVTEDDLESTRNSLGIQEKEATVNIRQRPATRLATKKQDTQKLATAPKLKEKRKSEGEQKKGKKRK